MEITYPTFESDVTYDNIFGTRVKDPFRWLEDPDSKKTKEFVQLQNDITMPYINSCAHKDNMKQKISSSWNFEKYGCPFQRGSKYYYFYNSGLQNQSVLYTMDSIGGPSRVFFDPNTLCNEGLVSLNTYSFSEDGKYFAFGLSSAGSDWVTIKVRNVLTEEDFPEILEHAKFTAINWTHDNKGFFYGHYPDAGVNVDGTETTSNENQKLMYHHLGTSQSEDVICVERPDHPKWLSSAEISDCGRYVFVSIHFGCERNNMLFYCDLKQIDYKITAPLELVPIIDRFEAVFDYITNEGVDVIIHTDLNAPMYKLIKINLRTPCCNTWIDFIPEDDTKLLEWAACVNEKKLVVCHLKDVSNSLSIYDLESGCKLKDIETPIGTIASFSGRKKYSMMFYQFTSFLTPGQSIAYDLSDESATPQIIFETKVNDLDVSNVEVQQVFYKSKDSTSVPMFILLRKGQVLDGSAPCLLYGYGGFAISLKPFFSLTNSIFIQNFHGIAAIANIRGGGEYGEKWHSNGKQLNKQNSFDDFICAGEFLIQKKYTSNKRLIIQGGSNGGLLVSACSNQRPDLFGAAIAQVPVTDMLRFHLFTIGHAWQSDYGNLEKEDVFRYLLTYSPLHTVPCNTERFPAMLILTGDHDDRVVPLHSLKYIATLQSVLGKKRGCGPLLVRVETKAGHGAGKPTSKRIDELVDIFAFIQVSLDLPWIQ